MAAPKRIWIIIAFAAVYLIWGSTYLGILFAIQSIPPFLMAGVRFFSAGAIMYGIARLQGAPKPERSTWWTALIIGACLLLGGNGGVTISEKWVPTGLAALLVHDAWMLWRAAHGAAAMSLEALRGTPDPFDVRVHDARPHPHQRRSAELLRALLADSEIRESHRENDPRVQDAYSLRCTPQVLGAVGEALDDDLDSPRALSLLAEAINGGDSGWREAAELLGLRLESNLASAAETKKALGWRAPLS